ncbi:MAG: hypothetical protein IJD85_02880 [Oscillospiraceae bacterium]|nr:hypothetical protein [Oscillospiraceae bacterium]
MNAIKARLLHFETGGDIIKDFVAARLKKAAKLRGIIHVCFYMQCVIAAACIAIGMLLGSELSAQIFSGIAGAVVIVVAFAALGGGVTEKTVSYILDMAYAVVCFFFGDTAMYICGGLMLAAAFAALAAFFAYYFRQWLLDYSPLMIREEHYTLKKGAVLRFVDEEQPEEEPLPPPVPQKSELMEVAEAFMEILK